MSENFTTQRIRRSTLERIKQWAEQGHRSVPEQLDLLADAFAAKNYQVISMGELPHPLDAPGVPVVYIQRVQES